MPEPAGGLAALLASLKSPEALKLVAAAAGAILSLSFIDRLTLRGRAVAVAQGFLTAVFVAPMVTTGVAHAAPFLGHVEMGVHFLLSLSSMAVLPPLLEYMRKRAADPFAGWGGFIGTLLRRAPSSPAVEGTER
ncbi:hypothetical protein [Brevundimonas sp.]|jgi:hypothetical protein|uniref:hypothetical protein n=1 Tax=Brevundimonas sp. TaxID=1871086 RepID=UPI0022C1D467|nr:hypothetical protein [Brevundimonas sp.]MCZ8195000.1 hypothetical protein [Brevundimonas sp.]